MGRVNNEPPEERKERLHRERVARIIEDRSEEISARTKECLAALKMAGVQFDEITAQVLHDIAIIIGSIDEEEENTDS